MSKSLILALGLVGTVTTLLGTTAAQTIPAPARPATVTAPQTVYDQLTPENSVVLLVDFQPQFVFSTRSTSIDALINNAQGLAKAARVFDVPIVTSTISAKAFAGPMVAELQASVPDQPIDRSVINAWHDQRVRDAIRSTGRRKLIIAGLWTDNCVVLPALSALAEGYDVYVVADASGDYDPDSHHVAIQRLVQAGAMPITWLPIMLEWQADWSRVKTAGSVNQIMRDHAKAVGVGGQYLSAVRP